jgi:hypothetical protein
MFPDFLIIGAQKGGTTWLDRNLRAHPDIWLPPEKEIHYFDLPRLLPFASLLLAPIRAARYWTRNRLRRDYAKVRRGEQTMSWYVRYYFSPRTQHWYRSLFSPEAGQISGEATPRYAVLSARQIARVCKLMPNLKLVYLLRDPIDRMWSDLAMFHDRRFGGEGFKVSDCDDVRRFLLKSGNIAHSRYFENLQRWENHFPAHNIFVGFQEEIRTRPAALLERVYGFLGVDPARCSSTALLNHRINYGQYPAIRPQTVATLASVLIDDTEKLHKRLGSPYTENWLRRMQSALANDASAGRVELA